MLFVGALRQDLDTFDRAVRQWHLPDRLPEQAKPAADAPRTP